MSIHSDDYLGLFFPAVSEVTEKGIKYKDKYYSSQTLIRKQWFHSSSCTRMCTVFVDTLNDDYLLIQLEDGYLSVAYQIENQNLITGSEVIKYYERLNRIKEIIKERRKKH
jgi:hypothetical protein